MLFKGTLLVGVVAALAIAADASDLIANTLSVVQGTPVSRLKDAASWDAVQRDYGWCMDGRAPKSKSSFAEAGLSVSLFDCEDGVVVLLFQNASGQMTIRPIYSPMFASRAASTAADRGGFRSLSSPALAQSAPPGTSPTRPEEIAAIVCQKPIGPNRFLVKLRLRDGRCVDQILDTSVGIVVQEIRGVSCNC